MQMSMKYTTIGIISFFILGCANESLTEVVANEDKGTIVLSLTSSNDGYTKTRATLTDISGYIFTLTEENGNKTQLQFNKEEGSGSFIANAFSGTYTLTAESVSHEDAEEGAGKTYYMGTSTLFSVESGKTTHTSIDMGSPKNAKISFTIDSSFSDLYDLEKIALSTSSRTVELLSADNLEVFFFPEGGTLSYTIQAKAKKNSHVQEMPATGVSGSLSIEAGKYYPLTLSANPVTGIIIPLGDDDWDGEFNAKQERF